MVLVPSVGGTGASRGLFFRSEKQVSLVFVYMTVFVDIMGESLVLPILGERRCSRGAVRSAPSPGA